MAMAVKTLAELRDQGRTAAALGDMLGLGGGCGSGTPEPWAPGRPIRGWLSGDLRRFPSEVAAGP